MKIPTAITLALLVAAIAAPVARTASSPDAFERAVNRYHINAPDAFERAVNRSLANAPDVFERAVVVHSRFSTLDPAIATAIADRLSAPSPIQALQGHTPVDRVVAASGFSWRGFALGAGSMLGLVVLLGVVMAARAMRSNRSHLPST